MIVQYHPHSITLDNLCMIRIRTGTHFAVPTFRQAPTSEWNARHVREHIIMYRLSAFQANGACQTSISELPRPAARCPDCSLPRYRLVRGHDLHSGAAFLPSMPALNDDEVSFHTRTQVMLPSERAAPAGRAGIPMMASVKGRARASKELTPGLRDQQVLSEMKKMVSLDSRRHKLELLVVSGGAVR